MLACALCAGYIIVFEYIHALSAEHGMMIGGGKGVGYALLIPNSVSAIHGLTVYRIAGNAKSVISLRHEWNIVSARTVACRHCRRDLMGTSIPSVNPMVFKKCWRFRFPLSDDQRLIISPHAKGSRYCLRRIDWPQETGILAMVIKNQRLMSMFLCAKCSSNILTASHRTAALVVKAEN